MDSIDDLVQTIQSTNESENQENILRLEQCMDKLSGMLNTTAAIESALEAAVKDVLETMSKRSPVDDDEILLNHDSPGVHAGQRRGISSWVDDTSEGT